MVMHERADVGRDLFPRGDEGNVSKLEDELQAQVRAYPHADDGLLTWARSVAGAELADLLPRRWAHVQGVALRAAELAPALGDDAELLAAAAILHDVGYAPALATTGFHPLDGARFLRDVHSADERLVRLVAHHSYAALGAEELGLRDELAAEFPLLEDQRLVDALTYSDMTTSPDGVRTTAGERAEEIAARYGADSPVGRFIRRASPEILAAVARVEAWPSHSVRPSR